MTDSIQSGFYLLFFPALVIITLKRLSILPAAVFNKSLHYRVRETLSAKKNLSYSGNIHCSRGSYFRAPQKHFFRSTSRKVEVTSTTLTAERIETTSPQPQWHCVWSEDLK